MPLIIAYGLMLAAVVVAVTVQQTRLALLEWSAPSSALGLDPRQVRELTVRLERVAARYVGWGSGSATQTTIRRLRTITAERPRVARATWERCDTLGDSLFLTIGESRVRLDGCRPAPFHGLAGAWLTDAKKMPNGAVEVRFETSRGPLVVAATGAAWLGRR